MPMLEDPVIAALLVAALAAVALVAVAAYRRASRRRLEALAAAFDMGTTRVVGLFGTGIEGLSHGYHCRYGIEHASQYNPGGATLRVRASSPLQWSAGVAEFGTRLMVRLGVLRDMRIGDDDLDQRLRFSSSDVGALLGLFGHDRTRITMRALAATAHFSSLTVRADRTDVRWAPRRPDLDEDPAVARARIAAALELLTACGGAPVIGRTIR